MKTTATLASLVIAVTSCVGSPDEDGRDDSFNDGKADSGNVAEGSRQAKGVLRVANEVSLEVLREDPPDGVGLADRAVDNIGDVRLGDDGAPGTADDGRFDTLAELDAVPFVGPIAFKKLLAYAEANGFVPRGTIVNGNIDGEQALLVYREGTGAWQPAVIKSPTSFEIEVDGPFVVLSVCEDVGSISIFETAQLPDEGDVFVGCSSSAGTHALTGHMVQAGRVIAGVAQQSSSTADWDFSLTNVDGTYDLVATTADSVAIRRNVAVVGDQVLAQAIDIAQEALPLAPVALGVANAEAGETVSARVSVRPATNTVSATVFSGAPANARVIVPTSLIASDRQRASITAKAGNFSRTLSRSVTVGGDTSFTLPPRLATPQWSTETGELQLRLPGVPPGDSFFVEAFASTADGATFIFHDFSASQRFATESGITQVTLDTNVPGFKPEWKIDLAAEYTRELLAFGSAAGDSFQTQFEETVNATTARRVLPRLPLAVVKRLEP
jgi:hypothetical protein